MDVLIRDARHALRAFMRSPGFTAASLLTLALGIGANTAMFSVVNGVLLRALPYDEPDRVVVLTSEDVDGTFGISDLERQRYLGQTRIFDAIGTYVTSPVNLTGGESAERLEAAFVDPSALAALGARPALGRVFAAEENRRGTDLVVILGHALWQRRFGADPSVLGQSLAVDGTARSIVGVMPSEFRMPTEFSGGRSELFIPLAPNPVPDPRNFHYMQGVARLADDVSLAVARGEMAAVSAQLRQEIATLPPTFEARLTPVRTEVLGDVRPALMVLLGAVGLLLLIASVNVANLFLARSEERQLDTSIRSALGAGRGRLLRQLFTESTILAIAALGVSLLLAAWTLQALVRLSPPNLPRIDELSIDLRVFLFATGVSLASAVLFGLIPALGVREGALQRALRDGGRSTTRAGGRMRRMLVVGEMALAVMLAVGGALLVQSFVRLQAVDAGFDRRDLLTVSVSLPSTTYPNKGAARTFYRDLLSDVGGLPGVVAVGAVNNLPMNSSPGDWGIRIEGREEERLPSGRRPWGDWIVTTQGYFESMGIRLREGRTFAAADTADASPVVMINATLADLYWPDGDALGKRFKMSSDIDEVYRTIIGIVEDVRHRGLDAAPRREFYVPYSQFPASQDFPVAAMTLVVRTGGAALSLTDAIRRTVTALDADVPVAAVRSMDEVVETSTSVRRLNALLFGAFGVLGLILVAIGVYGVMAYSVAQRTKELGVRMVLGADRREVVRMLVLQGMGLSLVGIAIGIAGALGGSRFLAGMLFGVGASDPVTLVGVPLLLSGVAFAACCLPALRATRADPISALRAE